MNQELAIWALVAGPVGVVGVSMKYILYRLNRIETKVDQINGSVRDLEKDNEVLKHEVGIA